MIKSILTSLLLVVASGAQSQWISIDTITFWGSQCLGGFLPLNPVIISSDTLFMHYSREKCSPSSNAYSAIYRTTNSCRDYELISYFASVSGDMILRKECPNGHTCFRLMTDAYMGWKLDKWTSSQGWTDITLSFYDYFYDMKFTDEHNGFIISNLGELYQFKDDTIEALTVIPNCYSPQIYLTKTDTNYILCKRSAAGQLNSVLRTSDNGSTWDLVYEDTTRVFITLQLLNDQSMLLVTVSNEVCRSVDYGSSWNPIFSIPSFIDQFSIVDDSTIYGLNEGDAVKSMNRGQTWNVLQDVSQYEPNNIIMLNDSTGFIFGGCVDYPQFNHIILKTVKGGLALPDYNKANSFILYPNPNNGKFIIRIPDEIQPSGNVRFQLFDMEGRLIAQKYLDTIQKEISIEVGSPIKGLFIAVITDHVNSYTFKLVIE